MSASRPTVTLETLIEKDGITTSDSYVYHLPDGWSVDRARDLLRDYGFKRIDNRQDSPGEGRKAPSNP